MKTISLKLDDSVFIDTEEIVASMQKPRNRYINEAIEFYNKIQRRKLLEKQLLKESKLVKGESVAVLKEFEAFEYDD